MQVVCRVAGDVVVYHDGDFGDVEATGGDVCGDQNAGFQGAEGSEVVGTLGLGELRVQGCYGVGEREERAVQDVGGGGAVGEDYDVGGREG